MTTEKQCLSKGRKPILPLKQLDIIFRRRYVPNTQHYFTNRKQAGAYRPPVVYQMPRSQKLTSYIRYSDEKERLEVMSRRAQPLYKQGSIKAADARDISQRLFMEEPQDNVVYVISIHPEFYTVIEGRPVRSYDDIKKYINNIRGYAMHRQQIGYRQDMCICIEKNILEETRTFDDISNKFSLHLRHFQRFLKDDHTDSEDMQAMADKVYAELEEKNNELLGVISELSAYNNIVFKLDSVRSVLKMYRTYCLFVSPLPWRQIYDESLKGKLGSIQFESGEFQTVNDLVESLDIDKTVELAKIELRHPKPPSMYFKSPEEMLYMFQRIEEQSREYLIQLSKTYGLYKQLVDTKNRLHSTANIKMDDYAWNVSQLKQKIEREKYNEKYYETKFFKIINELFYDTVASPGTLRLRICLEFVYEQVLGTCEEGHIDLYEPMKILEGLYEDYNLRLDSIDYTIVKKAISESFAKDAKILKNAFQAKRELKEFNELSKLMHRAFEPPRKFKRPVFTKFVDPKTLKAIEKARKKQERIAKGEREKAKKYKVTKEQREALMLFTEWCDWEDPAPYLKEYEMYAKPTLEQASALLSISEDDIDT